MSTRETSSTYLVGGTGLAVWEHTWPNLIFDVIFFNAHIIAVQFQDNKQRKDNKRGLRFDKFLPGVFHLVAFENDK